MLCTFNKDPMATCTISTSMMDKSVAGCSSRLPRQPVVSRRVGRNKRSAVTASQSQWFIAVTARCSLRPTNKWSSTRRVKLRLRARQRGSSCRFCCDCGGQPSPDAETSTSPNLGEVGGIVMRRPICGLGTERAGVAGRPVFLVQEQVCLHEKRSPFPRKKIQQPRWQG